MTGAQIASRQMVRPEWMDLAACKGMPSSLFFAEMRANSGWTGSLEEGRQVCARCRVQPTCLDYAIVNRERMGLWGGMTEKERRKVKLGRAAS